MSTLVLVEVTVKPERKDILLKMLRDGLPHTRGFDGCTDIQAYFHEEENRFVMVEHWQSKAHYMKYYRWREDSGALDQLQSCFDGEASIRFFDPVDA